MENKMIKPHLLLTNGLNIISIILFTYFLLLNGSHFTDLMVIEEIFVLADGYKNVVIPIMGIIFIYLSGLISILLFIFKFINFNNIDKYLNPFGAVISLIGLALISMNSTLVVEVEDFIVFNVIYTLVIFLSISISFKPLLESFKSKSVKISFFVIIPLLIYFLVAIYFIYIFQRVWAASFATRVIYYLVRGIIIGLGLLALTSIILIKVKIKDHYKLIIYLVAFLIGFILGFIFVKDNPPSQSFYDARNMYINLVAIILALATPSLFFRFNLGIIDNNIISN